VVLDGKHGRTLAFRAFALRDARPDARVEHFARGFVSSLTGELADYQAARDYVLRCFG